MADRLIEHLLRRAGFGGNSTELTAYSQLSYTQAVDRLVNYTDIPDTVDSRIGQSGYVNTTSRGQFSPNTVADDARQRLLFRMVHSDRPIPARALGRSRSSIAMTSKRRRPRRSASRFTVPAAAPFRRGRRRRASRTASI